MKGPDKKRFILMKNWSLFVT